MTPMNANEHGPPDISLAGLNIRIMGRQFEEADDFWDANWLIVTATCITDYSQATAKGPIIHLSEIERWITDLRQLKNAVHGKVRLSCMEPELDMHIKLGKTGSGSLVVYLTQDHIKERHEFTFPVDQSYLPALIRELATILRNYPIKGRDGLHS